MPAPPGFVLGELQPESRDVPLVVTEGNYLLMDHFPWAALRGLLDEVWYLELSKQTRNERLVDRHVRYGKSPQAARAWADRLCR